MCQMGLDSLFSRAFWESNVSLVYNELRCAGLESKRFDLLRLEGHSPGLELSGKCGIRSSFRHLNIRTDSFNNVFSLCFHIKVFLVVKFISYS